MPFHEKSGASGQDWAFNAALSSLKKKKKLKSSKQMYLVLPAVKRDEQQQSSPIFSKSLPQRVSQAPTLYVN